jgi:hypothetical protein
MPRRSKSSLSQAQSYREMGDFWESHDLGDFWDKTKEADFEVSIESEVIYYCLEKRLSEKVQILARKQGVSANTLINLWIQEKLQQC